MPDATTEQQTAQAAGAERTADVVVGILSHDNADTVGAITRDVQNSFASCLPAKRCVVVHADGGSRDGTQEQAALGAVDKDAFVQIAYTIYPAQKISAGFGVPGKANGVQAILGAASDMRASVCAVVDSTIGTPEKGSIVSLVRPVLENETDFVAPCYTRHKYDGAILNGIVYPLVRALYSRRIHQPIGGDYAVSAKLLGFLNRQVWPDDATSSDADAWVVVQTLCGGFRLAEASLGPRVPRSHDPAPDTSSILEQALGAIFLEMNRSAGYWQRTRGSQAVPMSGTCPDPIADPSPIDAAPMVQSFRLGYQNLQDIYRVILPPQTLVELKRMSLQPPENFRFDDMLWARVVYDFALAWRQRAIDRHHLLGALTPLYLGWVASWVRAVRDEGPPQVQARIEGLCSAYEAQKSYLISRWRWPDRFNP